MDKPILKLGIFQQDILWNKPKENLQRIAGLIEEKSQDLDVLILPEAFLTGFNLSPDLKDQIAWEEQMGQISNVCKNFRGSLVASCLTKEKEVFKNRLFALDSDQSFQTYDKKHVFPISFEAEHIQPGSVREDFLVQGWKVRPSICYDLRFPIWLRNDTDYELLVLVANWPGSRAAHWRNLLISRAIENQAYVVGVNRSGVDGNEIEYKGGSLVVDPLGQVICELGEAEEFVDVEIDRHRVSQVRKEFPFLSGRDDFQLCASKGESL